jgi:imidazolonepropionase-like amidohydrolase
MTRIRTLLAIAAALLLGAAAPRPAPPAGPVTAFVGVSVIPAYGERHLIDQTVLVRGDRIVAVGLSSRIRLPKDALVLGHAGQILTPGLADMHVHIFEPNDGVLYLANGVTTVRNMSGRRETTELAARIEAGAAPGPHIYSSSPILDGPQADWPNPHAVRTPEEMRRVVGEQADAGYRAVKLYENLAPNVFAAGVRAARARGLQVYAHVPFSMSLDQVLGLHIDSIEHLTGFDRALAPGVHSDWDEERWVAADARLMAPLARKVARSGVWNTATLVIYPDPPCAFADMAAAEAGPNYAYVTPRVRRLWRDQQASAMKDRDQALACDKARKGHQVRMAMVRALEAAHAPLLIGTDAPQPFVYPGFSLHIEMALHRDAGLSPTRILRIATVDAARFLHREGEFGVIRPGARADLLLLDGDPEADLAALRAPAGVMAAGRWYDAQTLAHMLADVAARVAAAMGVK